MQQKSGLGLILRRRGRGSDQVIGDSERTRGNECGALSGPPLLFDSCDFSPLFSFPGRMSLFPVVLEHTMQ